MYTDGHTHTHTHRRTHTHTDGHTHTYGARFIVPYQTLFGGDKKTKLTAQYYYLMFLNNTSKVLLAGFSDLTAILWYMEYNA